MNGTFDGEGVLLGRDGLALYEQGGYGRPAAAGIRLAPPEALYLILRKKITVKGMDFDAILGVFADKPNFIRSFLVYRDIRERGYVIQPGPHDFRVFRRGEKPGTGRSLYTVRVLSERDLIHFEELGREIHTAGNMRKQHILAVVDDEDELTYYEVKIQPLSEPPASPLSGDFEADLYGSTAILHIPEGSLLEKHWFGKRLDEDRLLLSPLETEYLLGLGCLHLRREGAAVTAGAYMDALLCEDVEFRDKVQAYADLRSRGYIPRTGYKFGHHFRVYTGKKSHSELLVHATPAGAGLPMSTISRSVRMAHSVKKKMLFASVHGNGIRYIEFTRIKL